MKCKLLIIGLILYSGVLLCQETIRDYELNCYCSGETPHMVIQYDNNFQLIQVLRPGLSMKDLDSLKIPYTRSQLKLLQQFNLIRMEGDKYYTNLSILDKEHSTKIREHSRKVAAKISPMIEDDIKEFISYLNESFSSQNAFSILFSYVLDGLIWDVYEERGIVEPRVEENNSSPWTGHFWMVNERRKQGYGTNSYTENNVTLYITNGVPWRFIKPLHDNDELRKVISNNISQGKKVSDQRVLETFSMYRMFDEQGNINIPVINESGGNKLYLLSKQIAGSISDGVVGNISLEQLVKEYNFKNKDEAMVIMYHEIMWDLLADILDRGVVKKPLILTSPQSAKMPDMTALLFFSVR